MRHMLALVTDGFGGRGGIARYNGDFLSALAAGGYHITVVARFAPDPEALPAGIVQGPARAGRLVYAWHVLQQAMLARPQWVFCGHLNMAPLAFVAAKLAGARLIMQTHGIEAWPRPRWLRRRAVECSALVLSVSRFTRARVLEWANLAPERVVIVPDTVGAGFTPGTCEDARRRWAVDGKKVLLTVGRMDRREGYKGHDRVIAALPALLGAGQDVLYLVAGEGDDRPRLEELAHSAGMADRVRFLGAVSRVQLVELYRLAELFVMPSRGEGFGIAFLEAMACGTPALGLGVGGARDALGEGDLGIMVAPEDDLAVRIDAALRAPGLSGGALAAATQARFGQAQFAARARAGLERLQAAPAAWTGNGMEGPCGSGFVGQ